MNSRVAADTGDLFMVCRKSQCLDFPLFARMSVMLFFLIGKSPALAYRGENVTAVVLQTFAHEFTIIVFARSNLFVFCFSHLSLFPS